MIPSKVPNQVSYPITTAFALLLIGQSASAQEYFRMTSYEGVTLVSISDSEVVIEMRNPDIPPCGVSYCFIDTPFALLESTGFYDENDAPATHLIADGAFDAQALQDFFPVGMPVVISITVIEGKEALFSLTRYCNPDPAKNTAFICNLLHFSGQAVMSGGGHK